MGNTNTKDGLWDAIESIDQEAVRRVLSVAPKLINEPITDDGIPSIFAYFFSF
jgi:hypothetical protein